MHDASTQHFRFRFLSDGGGSSSGSLPTFSKISFPVVFVVFLLSFCYLCVYRVFVVRCCVKTCAKCWVFIVFSYRVSLRPTLVPICVYDRVYCIFSFLPCFYFRHFSLHPPSISPNYTLCFMCWNTKKPFPPYLVPHLTMWLPVQTLFPPSAEIPPSFYFCEPTFTIHIHNVFFNPSLT